MATLRRQLIYISAYLHINKHGASTKRKHSTLPLMGATRPASGYFSAAASLAPPLEVAFCEQGVSPYVSYRQGDQPCLSLCEKTRRQPYVTCVAYVLMSTAVSGTRAKPKTAYFPDASRVGLFFSTLVPRAPIRGSVLRARRQPLCILQAGRQHISTLPHYHIDEKIPATPREGA